MRIVLRILAPCKFAPVSLAPRMSAIDKFARVSIALEKSVNWSAPLRVDRLHVWN